MDDVEFPVMRRNIVAAVESLADERHQWRAWVRRDFQEGGPYDDLTMVVSILDDLECRDDPEGLVGGVLRNAEEARAMWPLNNALEELFDHLGYHRNDEEYVRSPIWKKVVRTAQEALAVIDPR